MNENKDTQIGFISETLPLDVYFNKNNTEGLYVVEIPGGWAIMKKAK
jgi:hypothetical protein